MARVLSLARELLYAAGIAKKKKKKKEEKKKEKEKKAMQCDLH